MRRDNFAAPTMLMLGVACAIAVIMVMLNIGLPSIPGPLAIGMLMSLSGFHMIVFNRWRTGFNRRWQRIPGMYAGRYSAVLWIGLGMFFVAFGLLLTWAGLMVRLR